MTTMHLDSINLLDYDVTCRLVNACRPDVIVHCAFRTSSGRIRERLGQCDEAHRRCHEEFGERSREEIRGGGSMMITRISIARVGGDWKEGKDDAIIVQGRTVDRA